MLIRESITGSMPNFCSYLAERLASSGLYINDGRFAFDAGSKD